MSGKRKDTLPPDPPQLSHPLIDALFWMFGRSESPSNGNEGKGISTSNSTGELGGNGVSPYHAAQYSHGSSNSNNSDEREARRSLSWKDEMLVSVTPLFSLNIILILTTSLMILY